MRSTVFPIFSQIRGLEFYVAHSRDEVSQKYKNRRTTKFPKKYLVWQAICSCGQKSEGFVTQVSLKRSFFYILRAIPFQLCFGQIWKCHYGEKAKEFYDENEINNVPKEANPANCRELRPIEKY